MTITLYLLLRAFDYALLCFVIVLQFRSVFVIVCMLLWMLIRYVVVEFVVRIIEGCGLL